MQNDLLYQIALTMIPNIGDVHGKALVNHFGNAAAIFKAPRKHLEAIEGIGTVRARSIKEFCDFSLLRISRILLPSEVTADPRADNFRFGRDSGTIAKMRSGPSPI